MLHKSTNALYAVIGSASLIRCASCFTKVFDYCPLPSVAPLLEPPVAAPQHVPVPGFTTLASHIADFKRRQSGEVDDPHDTATF